MYSQGWGRMGNGRPRKTYLDVVKILETLSLSIKILRISGITYEQWKGQVYLAQDLS